MRDSSKGMILFSTIGMMIVLTLFVLSLLQVVFLHIKVSQQVAIKHNRLHQLESVAHKMMLAKNVDDDCYLTGVDPNQMVDMLLQHRGCVFEDNHHEYFYLFDDLGLYPCLTIQEGKILYSSHHWFITIATAEAKVSSEILQLRVAKPSSILTCEYPDASRRINAGVISWRYLS